jgi:hypothetical protein
MHNIRIALSLFLMIALTSTLSAQKDQVCKVWYNQEKTSRLEVYQVGNTFEAKKMASLNWIKKTLMINSKADRYSGSWYSIVSTKLKTTLITTMTVKYTTLKMVKHMTAT